MHVVVNGQSREVAPGSTVEALLAELGLGQSPCAVEVNQNLVPKRLHKDRALAEGDRIEIVTLVGGG